MASTEAWDKYVWGLVPLTFDCKMVQTGSFAHPLSNVLLGKSKLLLLSLNRSTTAGNNHPQLVSGIWYSLGLDISVLSPSWQSVVKSGCRSRLGLKAKHLNLISVSDLSVSFTSGEFFIFLIFFTQSKHDIYVPGWYRRDVEPMMENDLRRTSYMWQVFMSN